jgi:hypothetical protein
MSTEQGGTATWHTTITCPEDGDTFNENSLVTELAIPIIDRTKYLYDHTVERAPWARIRCTGGVLTVLDGSGVDSVAYISGSVVEVTLTEPMLSTNFGGVVSGWHTTVATPASGTLEPMTTTTVRVRLFLVSDGSIIDQGTDTAQYTVILRGS